MSPPTQTAAFGVDVGGTHTRLALVDRPALRAGMSSQDGCALATARLRGQRRWLTGETRTIEGFVERIADEIRQAAEEAGEAHPDAPIGLAIPGTLDQPRGRVVRCVNLPFLQAEAIGEALERRIGRRVTLCTDAEAATWGEYASRAAPRDGEPAATKSARFTHLRIGTGIACGAVIDGTLVRLDQNRRTHLPFLVVDDTPMALHCRCGLRGCLETVASGAALDVGAKELGLPDGLDSLEAAWQRAMGAAPAIDEATRPILELMERASGAVALALERIVRHFRADTVCLGGGVAARLPTLIDRGIARFVEIARRAGTAPPRVERARLGDDAGVVGAAALARD